MSFAYCLCYHSLKWFWYILCKEVTFTVQNVTYTVQRVMCLSYTYSFTLINMEHNTRILLIPFNFIHLYTSLSHLLARPWAFPHSSTLLFWVSAPVILTFPSAADWQIVHRLIEGRRVYDPPANSENQQTSHFIKLQYHTYNYFTLQSCKLPKTAFRKTVCHEWYTVYNVSTVIYISRHLFASAILWVIIMSVPINFQRVNMAF